MTQAEYKRRKTKEKTGIIARACLFCGNIDEWPENKQEGARLHIMRTANNSCWVCKAAPTAG